jgi:hypothetical protein
MGCVSPAAWGGPGQGARRGLCDAPAGGLLRAVMAATHGSAVAFASAAALVERHCVLVVACDSRAAAAGRGADGIADREQVAEAGAGLVAGRFAGMAARVLLEPVEGKTSKPA